VLLSALIFGGKPRLILEQFFHGHIDLIMSEEILTEMRRKITQKFPSFSKDLDRLSLLLKQDAEWVKLGTITITICRDFDDNRILETAVIGNCTYIVSGDQVLLILENHKNIQIVKPSEFLNLRTSNF